MRTHPKILFLATLSLVTALPAVSAQKAETTVKGEVIQVQQKVRTENGGEFDQIRIRTRQGEEMNLRVGNGGSCNGCAQVGDRIRARVRTEGTGQIGQVQQMRLQRGGHRYGYQLHNGGMVSNQQRLGAGHRGVSAGGGGGSRRGGGC